MIGIDFGTTNTCAAVPGELYSGYDATRAVNLRNGHDAPYNTLLASTVLDPLSETFDPIRHLGLPAQQRYMTADRREDHRYLNAFKPRLDDQRLRERRRVDVGGRREYDYVNQNDRYIPDYAWVEVGGTYSRAELVTGLRRIFDFVLARALEDGGEDDLILLGTPVSFSTRTRKRMLAALHATGSFAGYERLLRSVRFVHEPIAAAAEAMVEAHDFAGRERVLVFDHGGGTLDLSIVEFDFHDSFDHPVPMRELAAGGSDEVAGRSIDHALVAELMDKPGVAAIIEKMDEWDAAEYAEGAKIALSTQPEAVVGLPGMLTNVTLDDLERAMRPTLARITVELDRVCRRACLSPREIDRVVMTGGSSLVPAVQRTVAECFAHLDGDRLRSYDAADELQVERAITEVAQGLVRHAQLDTLRNVVHWDIELSTSESPSFSTVFTMGEEFDSGEGVRPSLTKRVAVADENRDGMCFGLYEHQLDRTFVFGLAEVKPTPEPAELEITLRADAPFPALRLLDKHGTEVARADLQALTERQLSAFFDRDVEYLPDTPFEQFYHAPLTQKLRVDDYVEWTSLTHGQVRRGRGRITHILRDDGSNESVREMDSWDLSQFRLFVVGEGMRAQFLPRHGYVRLAPRPPLP